MANKKKKARKGKKRLGSVVRVRKVAGLGQLNKPASMAGSYGPPIIGAVLAGGTTIALRMMTPTTEYQMRLMEYAPWVGGFVGSLGAAVLGMTAGRPAGMSAAAGATGVGLMMAASEAVARARMAPMMPADAGAGGGEAAVAGLLGVRTGAIVMEPHASRGYGAGKLGAIVPEYSNTRGGLAGRRGVGAYGDQVSLGNINQQAFGTPGFNVRGAR